MAKKTTKPSLSWQKEIETCADPHRALQYFEQLKAVHPALVKEAASEQRRILISVFAGSEFLSQLLFANPDWFTSVLNPEQLTFPRQKQGLQRELETLLKPLLKKRDYSPALPHLRQIKHREMLRIGARDLARLSHTAEITEELSAVADVLLDGVFQICFLQLTERFGIPYHQNVENLWEPTRFTVIGLGKLGGQELNYSSDVDVIFIYSDEGNVFKIPPRKFEQAGKGLSNHQFFTRLAESFIAEVTRLTPEGNLYRIDLRLRPEGDAGPLARSLGSYENFYAQWGQTWERMMLIKARGVAGDTELGHEFLETIQTFRYPRSLNERLFREVTAIKERIENEVVKAGEIDRDVKRGRGGIREIEFIAQSLQLLHAGKNPFLQNTQTIATLEKLVHYKQLTRIDVDELSIAYFFLRDVEHRLQMENDQQTHTIPTDRKSRERLARLMGFDDLARFEKAKSSHSANVRRVYDKLLKGDDAAPSRTLPHDFDNSESEWKKLLTEHSFKEVDRAFRLVREFVEGPGYVHVSSRTADLARDLLLRILALCPSAKTATDSNRSKNILSDPDRVLARLDTFISAYGARSTLYEMWARNPSLFELLILLFDRSEFLAEIAIRTPDVVDELEQSGRLRRSKTAEETLRDLHFGLNDADQYSWMRRYHEAELMRIGLRDILGLADFEHNLLELSALADACLQYALEVVMKKNRLKEAPFSIIGLGKLGGREINYGSDLDIVFVADAKAKSLSALQQMAVQLMDLLSARTERGSIFVTDARLRPDGEKGLLVNTLSAYEEYYQTRAQLWEIQALTRIRPVAGNTTLGGEFQQLAATLTNFKSPESPPKAYRTGWKKEIARMRLRIEKERTPVGKDELAIKTGAGGLMDAEFIAQIFCLQNGWQEANTLNALQRAKNENVLLQSDADALIENYRQLRRIEGILRRWSYAGEVLLPDDPAPMYRVAVRCGFPDASEFLQSLKKCRYAIRAIYEKVLSV
ncbi:MAG: glnE [Verrucomicrobiales bacterium]|nr:glnE [Verrucomicrobiales bacterium]